MPCCRWNTGSSTLGDLGRIALEGPVAPAAVEGRTLSPDRNPTRWLREVQLVTTYVDGERGLGVPAIGGEDDPVEGY